MFADYEPPEVPNALEDDSYMFEQPQDGLLSLPMLKGGINLGYGRESATSSVHYGDSHDTSELSNGQLSGRDGDDAQGGMMDGYKLDNTPSPLQYPSVPHWTVDGTGEGPGDTSGANGTNSDAYINGGAAQKTNASAAYDELPLERKYQHDDASTRTPQQRSSTPELPQSHEQSGRKRTLHSTTKGKSELRANSSIPADLSWPEFGRQCILAAENSRLNPFALHPAEYNLLREHINHAHVTIYLNIRNAILRTWHRNPLVYVSLEEAAGCARDKRFFGLAKIAYQWLLRNGYINYGCVDVPKPVSTTPRKAKNGSQRTILVVGAGMSGLGCARHLEGLFAQQGDQSDEGPPKIIILEARPRVGGRVYSHPFRDQAGSTLPPGHRCTAEMGAQIVTGFEHGNPMNAIIRGQLALPYHGLRDNTILYDYDGSVVERSQDMLVEKLYNDVLERASVYRNKPAAHRTVEGDRNLIAFGRDAHDTGGPTIAQLENSDKPLSVNDKSEASTTEEKPTTGVEKLAGRAYQLSAGFNPNMTAAEVVQSMGWALKPGVSTMQSVNMNTIAKGSEFPTLGHAMDDALKQYQALVEMQPRDMRLLNWHHANLEYANAVNVNKLSLSGWDQDMGNEFEGEHSEVIGGYQQVPRGLWKCPNQLDVRFNTPVKSVEYNVEGGSKAVRVESNNGEVFEADHIVLTTPLGVLKSGAVTFSPPLPDWKQGVIERMGFGLLNKIILVYEEAFWEPERDMFGLLNEAEGEDAATLRPEAYSSKRGRFYLFWNCTITSGKPTLIALMAGESAHYAEATSNAQLVTEVTERLQAMFAPKRVPAPSETIVTRWSRDPYARGSYSYVEARTQTGDYDVMAAPHGPLHFAGEATCGTHPATVHGAYLSGLRAASEVYEAITGAIAVPQPLIEEKKARIEYAATAEKRKAEPASKPARAQRDDEYEAGMMNAILTEIGERPVKPGRAGVNPFLLFTKDQWYAVKAECDAARVAATGNAVAKAAKQEIRIAIGARWRNGSAELRRPYQEQAERAREDATASAADFQERVAKWDSEAARIRREYVVVNPPPGGNEDMLLSRATMEIGAGKRLRRL